MDPWAILEENPLSILGADTLPIPALSRVDWKETPEAYIIKFDVPGIRKEDIKIEHRDDLLIVSGEIKEEEVKADEKWHRVERVEGKFVRQFRLVDGDMERVKAVLENGVLTVTVPKKPQKERQPKPVPIEVVKGNSGEISGKTCEA